MHLYDMHLYVHMCTSTTWTSTCTCAPLRAPVHFYVFTNNVRGVAGEGSSAGNAAAGEVAEEADAGGGD